MSLTEDGPDRPMEVDTRGEPGSVTTAEPLQAHADGSDQRTEDAGNERMKEADSAPGEQHQTQGATSGVAGCEKNSNEDLSSSEDSGEGGGAGSERRKEKYGEYSGARSERRMREDAARGGAGSPDHDDDKNKKKLHRRGKVKGGRRHSKQWKPYSKMSWSERQALEERETKRATEKREQQFAAGQPMAPYNTTQFLMEQHEGEPGFEPPQNRADLSGSMESSEEYDSPDEDIFLEKEFTETYENCHAERLQALTKDELVREYLELEERVERLERRLRESSENGAPAERARTSPPAPVPNGHLPAQAEPQPSIDLESEVRRLRTENDQLQKERDSLATRISNLNSDSFRNLSGSS